MNKKLSIFAIVLIIVGLIGSICSGFFSMPYFIDKLQTYDERVNKEKTIYEENIDINKLNISTKYADIEIAKSNSNNVVINTNGLVENSEIKVTNKEKTLSIEEVINENKIEKIKSMDDFINKILENTFTSYRNVVVVYVPQDVNLEVITENGNLVVRDDIFLNNLEYKTYSGNISIPVGAKKLENMSLTSQGDLSIQLSELLGINQVNIDCNSLYIGNDKYSFNDIENYLPEKVIIKGHNLNEGDITIESDIPISKNLIIDAYKYNLYLNLPLDEYKFDFDIKAYDNIELNEYLLKNYNDNTTSYEIKEFKKILNEDLKDQYKVDVSVSKVLFQ